MTKREFKAWFDGFTEAFDGKVPSAKQWARIKEQVGRIDDNPETPTVIYRERWPHHWPYPWYVTYSGTTTSASPTYTNCNSGVTSMNVTYAAWNAQGRLDAGAV